MDKYALNIKTEKIVKLVRGGDYETAAKVADTVDWEEVRSVRILTMGATAYEKIGDFKTAIEILEQAYNESNAGQRILYKLTALAIADGDANRAETYYEAYKSECPEATDRYLLRYLLSSLEGQPVEKLIPILERYQSEEFDEEWSYRLAELYAQAGLTDKCVALCDKIILWFGVGDYVDAAMALKEQYASLTEEQQAHRENKAFYEQRYATVVSEYNTREKERLAQSVPAEEAEKPDGEAEPAEESGTSPVRPEEEDWSARILLVAAGSLEEAIPKALESLSEYYTRRGKAMRPLTRVPAGRLNVLGIAGARPRFAGKDVLVDDAADLTEALMRDLVQLVREEDPEQLFVLTEEEKKILYLNNRLCDYIKGNAGELPSIEITQPEVAAEGAAESALADAAKEMIGEPEPAAKAAEAPEKKTTVPKETLVRVAPVRINEFSEPAPKAPEEELWIEEEAKPQTWPVKEEPEEAPDNAEPVPEAPQETSSKEGRYVEPTIEDLLMAFDAKEAEEKAAKEQAAEAAKAAEEAAKAEEARLAEEAAKAAEAARAEEMRLAEEARKAEEARLAEEARKVQEALRAEEARLAQAEAERAAALKAEEERLAAQKAEAERLAAQKAEEERLAALKAEEERLAAQKAEAERLAAVKAEAERRAREEAEKARLAAEAEAEKARLAAEAEAEKARLAAEAEKARLAAQEEARKAEEAARKAAEETETKAEETEESAAAIIEESPRFRFDGVREEENGNIFLHQLENFLEDEEPRQKAETEAPAPAEEPAPQEAEEAPKADPPKAEAPAPEEKKPEEPKAPAPKTTKNTLDLMKTTTGMTIDGFIEYAKNYIRSIDCVLDDSGEEALYLAAKVRMADGTALTKKEAEDMIEQAADMAERRGGLFTKRYNKDDMLIIRGKYIR